MAIDYDVVEADSPKGLIDELKRKNREMFEDAKLAGSDCFALWAPAGPVSFCNYRYVLVVERSI